jgi:hypothetical protein
MSSVTSLDENSLGSGLQKSFSAKELGDFGRSVIYA